LQIEPGWDAIAFAAKGTVMMLTCKDLPARSVVESPLLHGPRAAGTEEDTFSLDDFKASTWVQAYDAAWLGERWKTLERMLEHDVTLMSTDFARAIRGRNAVLEHLRALRGRTVIHEYTVAGLKGYTSGPVGIITYRWQLDWSVDRERRSGTGRDILVLQPSLTGWLLSWRGQTVRQRPGTLGEPTWPSEWDRI
jgi:hypothetical protein